MQVMNEYGADALRLCLLSTPVVKAEDLRFSEAAVREVMRTVILPLWNAYSFLVTYARVDGWEPAPGPVAPPAAPENALDRWVLSQLEACTRDLRQSLDGYDLQKASTRFVGFIDDLTNWYIRRSRRRFWKSTDDADKAEAYQTLHYVLVSFCKLAAPFIPFVTDSMYRNLRTAAMPESVHLCDYPTVDGVFLDEALNRKMAGTMSAVSLGRFLRTQSALKIRQPLQSVVLVSAQSVTRADLEEMAGVIAEELNVKEVRVSANEEDLVHLSAKANFKKLGPKLGRRMRAAAAVLEALPAAEIGRLRTGARLTLDLGDGGEPVEIVEEDILVQRQERAGMAVANAGDITVALDTTLSEALVCEGWARDLVSRLQNLRKEARLEVTDRIAVIYQLPPVAVAAVREFAQYIGAETLAVSLEPGELPKDAEAEINGESCRLAITKVSVGP
jgi:isoleucyl-tRNA synthetase